MAKRLTEVAVKKLRIRPKLYVVWDSLQTGLGLKVTPAGKKIWCAQLRYPGHTCQTVRTLGHYHENEMGVAEAREKAGQWYALVKQGRDPEEAEAEEQEKQAAVRRAEALKKQHSFVAVAERSSKNILRTNAALRIPPARFGIT